MDFKNIDKKYRPVPFWSWNEKLTVEESVRQTKLMDEAGMGGYFMHARGGLQTEYMSEEWFENVGACIDECNRRGMHAWAYDENGWPSGFGGGRVNGKGEKYWQKYLRVKKLSDDLSQIPEHRIIAKTDAYCFYYDVNEFYVDTLSKEVTLDFIDEIYKEYFDRFGTTFDGFFTDEPQISRNGVPWSLGLPMEYEARYGESLLDVLECIFYEVGDYQTVRMKFWKMIAELFSAHFMKPIYDFCQAHGVKLTGHLVLEESLGSQLISNGCCMPHYEYFDIPGMDWLGRDIYNCLTVHQLTSAAAQTGKKQILTESFACCGHNVSHTELKRNYEWMMVRGVNLLCQHLEGYSLRGIRKRDFPPAMYYQQPWWDDYKAFNDAMSRVGMLICEGKIECDTLLMHNEASAWCCFNCKDNGDIRRYERALLNDIKTLEQKHVAFHLGDEILMERHGRVEGNKLIIGEMSYSRVLLPDHIAFLPNTQRLLDEFAANGGIITTADAVEANNIVDNPNITYTKRIFDDFVMHYFVNSTGEPQQATINCGGKELDIKTGDTKAFCSDYSFPANGSVVVIDDGTPAVACKAMATSKPLDLGGKWKVVSTTENAMTLDKCTYWINGELCQENGYVLNVIGRANALEEACDVVARFDFDVSYIPEEMLLACETPWIFDIKVNGKPIDKTDRGYFRDKAFRKLDITDAIVMGKNSVELSARFGQSETVYENIRKSKFFESEKNKLTFDMELEPMYLLGDFGVSFDGEYEPSERNTEFLDGRFKIVKKDHFVELKDVHKQGYPFFAGEITVSKTFELDDTDYKLSFDKTGFNCVRVKVNGKYVDTILWQPYELELGEYLTEGKNTVELTLVNNLRNLLGPHHHTDGEITWVSPASFYHEGCIWTGYHDNPYTEKYSIAKMSVE